MDIHDFRQASGEPVQAFGSVGVAARPLVRDGSSAVTVLHVEAGGEIGRHPAPVDRLLIVVSGRARVQGGDGTWADVTAGQAAAWRAGEEHLTRAVESLTALVVEALTMQPGPAARS
jgi:quercetin dioxygenase-like cupin family protein